MYWSWGKEKWFLGPEGMLRYSHFTPCALPLKPSLTPVFSYLSPTQKAWENSFCLPALAECLCPMLWYCWTVASHLQHYLSCCGSLCFYLTATMVASHAPEAGCLVLCRSGRVLEKSLIPSVSSRLVRGNTLPLVWGTSPWMPIWCLNSRSSHLK